MPPRIGARRNNHHTYGQMKLLRFQRRTTTYDGVVGDGPATIAEHPRFFPPGWRDNALAFTARTPAGFSGKTGPPIWARSPISPKVDPRLYLPFDGDMLTVQRSIAMNSRSQFFHRLRVML